MTCSQVQAAARRVGTRGQVPDAMQGQATDE